MERRLAAQADVLTEQTGANLCSLQLYQGPGARAGEITVHIHIYLFSYAQISKHGRSALSYSHKRSWFELLF